MTTPSRRSRYHPSLSPPTLRTPSKSNGSASENFSSWTSDRFIPNRSHFRVDICRASVESAEKNLSATFEKLSRQRSLGENGNPNPRSPPPNPSLVENAESMTPLQAEFRRRMRGALLNIPLDDSNSRFAVHSGNGGNVTQSERISNSSIAISSPSATGSNRENVSSIVYASLPDSDEADYGAESSHTGVPRRGFQRMLSFQGVKREESFHSTSSSSSLVTDFSLKDSVNSDAVSTTSTPIKLRRHRSASSHLFTSSTLPKAATIDPFSHDQLHVLHRAATSGSCSQIDSISMVENRLRSVAKSVGRRIPKTPSRILDAPELVDDYYLNLVSWGINNVLAVALGQCVYLWEADTGNIRHLLTLRNDDDFVTSVSWATVQGNKNYIAIGTNHNAVQL